jgi:hypothetical protein
MLVRFLVPVLFLSGSMLLSAEAFAQRKGGPSGKGPAYVSPPKQDANYPLMGEFVGNVKTEGKKRQRIALQVRPISGNEFDARVYRGGLPGQSQHEPEAMRLIGLRSGNSVVLSGGPWAIFVHEDGCSLVSPKGKLLGKLDRVERMSPTLGAQPPEGAMVLFDGTDTKHLIDARVTPNGLLKEGFKISPMFQDFNLHVEFRIPYMPFADGQSRGNSGLYLQQRYECQVLDSFATEPVYNGLGALYRQKKPDVNMALPPLVWQTYDVEFTAPRWAADGSKIRNAHVTSWVNGVKVQDNVALPSKTGAGKPEEPTLLPILIQDHGDPVRFRNFWIVDRGLHHVDFPVKATKEQRQAAAAVGWEDEPVEKKEASKADESKADESKADESKADESKADESKAEGSKADESKVDEAKTEEPQADSGKQADAKPAAENGKPQAKDPSDSQEA